MSMCLNSACLFMRLSILKPLSPEAKDTFYKLLSGNSSLLNIRRAWPQLTRDSRGGICTERLCVIPVARNEHLMLHQPDQVTESGEDAVWSGNHACFVNKKDVDL